MEEIGATLAHYRVSADQIVEVLPRRLRGTPQATGGR
jgi:hypothetical protein